MKRLLKWFRAFKVIREQEERLVLLKAENDSLVYKNRRLENEVADLNARLDKIWKFVQRHHPTTATLNHSNVNMVLPTVKR